MSAQRPVRLAGVTGMSMAFVGGYVDVIGFVLLFGLFVAHATGNIVMLGVGLAGDASGLASKLLALPVFIGTAAAAYALIRWRNAKGQPCEVLVLALQAVLLLVFMLLTARALPAADANAPGVMLAGLVGVVAMAVQNVAARVVFAHLAPTTMMTGNVTQIAIDIVDLAVTRGRPDEALRVRIRKTWPPVLAFALGAMGGALGVLFAGPWSLALGVVVVAVLAALHALRGKRS
ncbi:YoaK family protein [Caulobacter sp. CCH9-E1]|uniref:YoaK family protein n=1 Tax=Caulobacter sp. CCH9-E1 TaxID=1768768 RepID=UPI000AD3EF77|nr:YoaK family protein [Caulobacter sp. CCH9-E1]